MKQEIISMLEDSLTKQVFAYEEIILDKKEKYLEWAENMAEQYSSEEVQNAIWPLYKYIGMKGEEINYWELKSDLRFMLSLFRVTPPKGADAVGLFLYGFLQNNEEDIRNEKLKLGDCLWKIHEILGSCTDDFPVFDALMERYIYIDENPEDTYEIVEESFRKSVHHFLGHTRVNVRESTHLFVLELENISF